MINEFFLLAIRRGDNAGVLQECFDAVMAEIDKVDAQETKPETAAMRAIVRASFSSFEQRLRQRD
jgi:hypothetical protein